MDRSWGSLVEDLARQHVLKLQEEARRERTGRLVGPPPRGPVEQPSRWASLLVGMRRTAERFHLRPPVL